MTPTGHKREAEVLKHADRIVESLHDDGTDHNFVQAFWDRYGRNDVSPQIVAEIMDDCDYLASEKDLNLFAHSREKYWRLYGHPSYVDPFAEYSLRGKVRWIFREAENAARELAGLPAVGGGWVNETNLFFLLRDEFRDTKVIAHGRPTWLNPQHLDIYFPEYNVGVEYQGDQHFRPVKLFGGERALAANQERDARKRTLCATANCTLVEVLPGYDPGSVVNQVRAALSSIRDR
jgi:hypothetical protein